MFADRGYYSYENDAISIKELKIVPLIFPRKNCNFSKLFNMMTYPFKIFDSKRDTEAEIAIYKRIITKFKQLISDWKNFQKVRSIIEDIFKLTKKAYSMERDKKLCYELRKRYPLHLGESYYDMRRR